MSDLREKELLELVARLNSEVFELAELDEPDLSFQYITDGLSWEVMLGQRSPAFTHRVLPQGHGGVTGLEVLHVVAVDLTRPAQGAGVDDVSEPIVHHQFRWAGRQCADHFLLA